MESLLISVIIPVYNVEKYINQCVDSVLSQTYQNIEVILVDDGSTDHCPEICDNYARKDFRVKVIHKENGGLSSARNAGIEIATGDYGIYVDSDDYWMTTTGLEELVSRVLKYKTEVLSFNYSKYEEKTDKFTTVFETNNEICTISELSKEEQLERLTKYNFYIASAWNKLISIYLLKKVLFDVGKVSEDIEWCARLISEAQSFDYIDLVFYCYRQRAGSISKKISTKNCKDLAAAILGCIKIAETADESIQKYLYRYTAYQYCTFLAVQSFAVKFQEDSIKALQPYASVLEYFRENKKIKYMYIGIRIFGLKAWCLVLKRTRKIWNRLR